MKKGFTLIELLAVIIILAVIALIATPIVLNVIDNAKKEAAKSSAYGYIDGVKLFYADTLLEENDFVLQGKYTVDSSGNLNGNNIKVDGTRPSGGYLKYIEGKVTEGCLTISEYKSIIVNGKVTQVEKGACAIDESPSISVDVYGIEAVITLEDNDGIIAYAITGNEDIPSIWEDIDETKSMTETWKAYESGTYYAWAKNKYGDIKKEQFKITEPVIYGIKRSLNTSETTWTRIERSDGLVAEATKDGSKVKNDFDNIYPWSDIITYNYDTTATINQITAYYGDSNFSFTGSNGEVLTKIPEFYYKRYQDETYEYIYISKDKIDDSYEKSEEFSVGRYTMSGSSERIHSVSGQVPFQNKTIADYRTYARALGNGFGQMDYHYFILQMLYLVEYADYNSQAKLGLGRTNSSNKSPNISGGCDDLGMLSGTLNDDGKHSMIYRGIEDIFGNVWQLVDGINIKNHQAYICYDQSKYESDKFDGDCYKPIGYINATTNGWITKLGYDPDNPMVAFPIEVLGGSGSTYISDDYGQNNGNRVVRVGGNHAQSTTVGLWHWNTDGASSLAGETLSARLLKTS